MIGVRSFGKNWIYLIPGLYFSWSWFLLRIERPFFLSRIDPEYIHLLNGLNCALVNFNRIGHVDNPGTPFQLLSGFLIRIIHTAIGRDSIIDDVLQRPELYLSIMSVLLALVTTGVLIWLGRLLWNKQIPFLQVAIIQCTLFVSTVLIDIPSRYTPDRLLSIIVLVLVGFCIKYLFTSGFNAKQFANYTGIFSGIGLVTKLTFIPFLILPWIILSTKKSRIRYTFMLSLSTILCFLPIHRRFRDLYYFTKSLILHDSLYGQGEQQMFNISNIVESITYALQHHWLVWLLLVPVIIAIIYGRFDQNLRVKFFNQYRVLIAILLVFLLTGIMMAKHYKNYYTIPVQCIIPFGYFLVVNLAREVFSSRKSTYLFSGFFLVILMIPIAKTTKKYLQVTTENAPYYAAASFIKNQIPSTDYFLVEPTWLSSPLLANGLVFGISYVRHHDQYFNNLERHYPNIITWEGGDKPLSYFRVIEAVNETILKSGKNIHVLSSPGRNASTLITYLEKAADTYGISLKKDTIYENTRLDLAILRIHNDAWKIIIDTRCGFESQIDKQMWTDDEKYGLVGFSNLYTKTKTNGSYSIILNPGCKQTPAFQLDQSRAGDFLEVTIKRRRSKSKFTGNLEIYYQENGKKVVLKNGRDIDRVHKEWEFVRLDFEITSEVPVHLLKVAYHYPGDGEEIVDDFSIRLCRKLN